MSILVISYNGRGVYYDVPFYLFVIALWKRNGIMSLMAKKCKKCGELKHRAEFSSRKDSSDGLQSWCRPCVSKYISDPGMKASRKTYNKNYKLKKRGVVSSPNWTEEMKEAANVRNNALLLFKEAVSVGRIVRASNCVGCRGEFKKYGLYPFHRDYKKPYDVLWVCHPCFRNLIKARSQAGLTGG